MARGLLLVMVVAYTSGARGFTTNISNGSSRTITATTSYASGQSQFQNRVIAPGTSKADQYDAPLGCHIEIWVEGSGNHNQVLIHSDQSIVGVDNGDKSRVDIYLGKYGSKFDREGDVLVTIFP